MTTLYSNSIRTYLRTRDWPVGLIWEIVEFEDCIKFKVYRDNINSLDSEDKLQLAKLLNEALTSIRDNGVPIYTWVEKGDGRRERTD